MILLSAKEERIVAARSNRFDASQRIAISDRDVLRRRIRGRHEVLREDTTGGEFNRNLFRHERG
jgi:hypothetical protein